LGTFWERSGNQKLKFPERSQNQKLTFPERKIVCCEAVTLRWFGKNHKVFLYSQ